MDFKQYNRKVIAHLVGLLEASEMDHWHMVFDLKQLDQTQGLERFAQADGSLVLNFNPMACREFHVGEEHITCNMSLQGRKTHLVLPFTAVRGIQLELQEVPVYIPADIIVVVIHTTDSTEPGIPPAEPERRAVPEGKVVPLFGERKPTTKET